MSFVVVGPEWMSAAAADLASIGSSINAASAGTRAQNYPAGIASTVALWSARYQ